jgi:hypothetical protein
MSYILDKFEAGEVHVQEGAVGWLMSDGEFRPLMSDAVAELKDAGLICATTVVRTEVARKLYTQKTLAEYTVAQKNRTAEQIAEERWEARAAFGPGETIVNMITGEKYTT